MSSLVTNIQFHDITRQQLQNVNNVVSELGSKINSTLTAGAEEDEVTLLSYIHKVAKLQSAHLLNSRQELDSAISEINAALHQILSKITSISENIIELVEAHGENNENFFERITQELTEVVALFSKSSGEGKNFSYSIKDVADTITTLAKFINEIDEIGAEIELISLNANVKAAHTGKEGAALGVLAEAIQKLSGESKKQTGLVVEKLISVKNASSALHQSNSDEVVNASEKQLIEVTGELNSRISSQNEVVKDAMQQLNEIQKAVFDLKSDLNNAIELFDSYTNLTEHISEVINLLNETAHQTEEFSSIELPEHKLNELNKNYTMKIQRDIHQQFTAEHLNDDYENEEEKENEFGDNVELF